MRYTQSTVATTGNALGVLSVLAFVFLPETMMRYRLWARSGEFEPRRTLDIIFFDGIILTGEALTSGMPRKVSALAAHDGLIADTGSDAGVLKLRGPKSEVFDLLGAFVMPGFNDAHVHLSSAGCEKLTAVAHGITSLQDYSTWDDFLVYEEMEKESKLPVRISEWLTFLDPLPTLLEQRGHHSEDDPMLHTGMLKGFMDGSLVSRTAPLNAPYSDDSVNSGIPQFDQATLNRMTVDRAQAGFQIGFHAIGGRGVKMALDAFVAAQVAVPNSVTYRFRIEHDQVVDPHDFARYKLLGVIASMQPNHLLSDMYWAEERIGPERAKYSYTWKTFWDQGTVVAFGTDYPVEPVIPFRGLLPQSLAGAKTEQGPIIRNRRSTSTRPSTRTRRRRLMPSAWRRKKISSCRASSPDFIVLDRDLLLPTLPTF